MVLSFPPTVLDEQICLISGDLVGYRVASAIGIMYSDLAAVYGRNRGAARKNKKDHGMGTWVAEKYFVGTCVCFDVLEVLSW